MFYISNENIEEALKVISGFHVEKIDLVKFTTFNMVLAQKEFRERIYQHYCELFATSLNLKSLIILLNLNYFFFYSLLYSIFWK